MAFDIYKLKYSVALENVPQIILQIIFVALHPSEAGVTVSVYMAMISSFLSVLSAFLNYTLNSSIPTKHERFTLTIKHGKDSLVNDEFKGGKTDRKVFKKRKRMFKCVGKAMCRAFDIPTEGLEIVAISHYFEHTDICIDFIGDGHSLSDRYARDEKHISEAIHGAFELNYVYPTEFRENLKHWEIEKMNFINKYSKMQDAKEEKLEFDGKEWLLHIEMLRNTKENTESDEDALECVPHKVHQEIELGETRNTTFLSTQSMSDASAINKDEKSAVDIMALSSNQSSENEDAWGE